jgi:hypothetical protein
VYEDVGIGAEMNKEHREYSEALLRERAAGVHVFDAAEDVEIRQKIIRLVRNKAK